MKLALKWIIALVIGGVCFAGTLRWARGTLDAPANLPQSLVYRVFAHARFSRVATELAQRGAIAHPQVWTVYARMRGLATQIKAGEYLIPARATPRQVLAKLVAGDVILHSLTIVDGWRFQELRDAIDKDADIKKILPRRSELVMARVGSPAADPEGQFLPETYKFSSGTTDQEILGNAHTALVKELADAWASRDMRLPLHNAQEMLTLASIVEKETGLAEERAKIAGVYVQRLLSGMRLQADPTVIYGLGSRYDGNVRTIDLRTDGPYNTYTRAGLPPTPICLPGSAALRATAHPELTGALFFVATGRGDGSHTFSATLEEHNRAVADYLERTRAREHEPVRAEGH